MGLFDKAKRWIGLSSGGPSDTDEAPEAPAPRPRGRAREGTRPAPPKDPPAPTQSVEDALALREAGDRAGARALLVEMDRGAGLRTVLRAAAALEDGDDAEVASLAAVVRAEATAWKLPLQLAAALAGAPSAAAHAERAVAAGAPPWALAWTNALAPEEATRRGGLVALLIADAPLARTVGARDLGIEGVVADGRAADRFAAFAHGRDCIRRFGAESVERLVTRVLERSR